MSSPVAVRVKLSVLMRWFMSIACVTEPRRIRVTLLMFAASATLYAASVPMLPVDVPADATAADSAEGHGGCHGAAGDEQAPAHPAAKSSCCDITCHAWLPPALAAMPAPPHAAEALVARIAAFDPQTADGIDRPPRP